MMNTGTIGVSGPRLRVDRKSLTISARTGKRNSTATIRIVNDGRGELRGRIFSSVPWIHIRTSSFLTTFIHDIIVEIDPAAIPPGSSGEGIIGIISNGGSIQIPARYIPSPQVTAVLSVESRTIQICNLARGETTRTILIIRNQGEGFLSGSVSSDEDWITIPSRTIWTRDIQVIPVDIRTGRAPGVLHPVGRIHIRTNGGEETVTVSLGFAHGSRPVIRVHPERIRVSWNAHGIIEERLLIANDGMATLRGTIPASLSGLTAVPAIFTVEPGQVARIIIRIDTRRCCQGDSCTVTLPVITSIGPVSIPVEVTRSNRHPVKRPPVVRRRLRPVRRVKRMTAYVNGEPISLVSSGKAGGEGEIWFCPDAGNLCVKVFHPHRITPDLEEKIREMAEFPPGPEICARTTWPKALVSDKPSGGRFIGYLMTRIPEDQFRPSHLWYDQRAGSDDIAARIRAAGELAFLVDLIHKAGHGIGDLRENNILVSGDGQVLIIDTDSFQIRGRTKRLYPSMVGTGEYLPPELLRSGGTALSRDRIDADRFALGILIFRFLMDGVHPFQAKGELVAGSPATTDKILLGYYAYETRTPGISPPEYAPPYTRVPPPVRSLFYEVFVTGHSAPEKRPNAARWHTVLSQVQVPKKPEITRPVTQAGDQQIPPKVTVPPLHTDRDGIPVTIRDQVLRVTGGTVFHTDREGYYAVIFQQEPPSGSRNLHWPAGVSPSWIMPASCLCNSQGIPCGYLVPAFDPARYRHWHVVCDPETRVHAFGSGYSFHHRIAACRNLAVSLTSLQSAGLFPLSFSERSVFTGPDSSVRIFVSGSSGTPRSCGGWAGIYVTATELIHQMLTGGYRPGRDRRGTCIRTLPVPVRRTFERYTMSGIPPLPGEWFSLLDAVFHQMTRCPKGLDHWYLAAEGWCPFCHPNGPSGSSLPPGSVPILLPMESASTNRRRVRRLLRLSRRSRPSASPGPFLLATPGRENLLPGCRYLACLTGDVHGTRGQVHYQSGGTALVPAFRVPLSLICVQNPEPFPGETSPSIIPDISLIDEMRWYSAMDRLRGDGFVRIKKKRMDRMKQGKCPVQVMLFPIDLPGPVPGPDRVSSESRGKKGIRKKIQIILDDFMG